MKKTATLIVALCAINLGIKAQVGIGNNFPNDSTILDLTNLNNKGLLLPKSNGTLPNPTSDYLNGMLLFSDIDSLIYVKTSSSTYNGLSPWKYKINANASDDVYLNNGSIGIGYPYGTPLGSTFNVDGDIHATGDINTDGKLQEGGNDLMPAGTIVMWHGNFASVPAGWAVCDGTNGTPNLQERFLVGGGTNAAVSGGGYSYGQTGGARTVALTTAQMPSHNHSMNHSHSVNDPGHDHSIYNDESSQTIQPATDPAPANQSDYFVEAVRDAGIPLTPPQSIYHSANAALCRDATTGITVGASSSSNTGSNGSGSAHENRPPFYVMTFIMKL